MGQIDSSTAPEECGMQAIHRDCRKKKASAVRKVRIGLRTAPGKCRIIAHRGEEQAAD